MPTVLVVNPDTSALLVAGTSIADKNTILISYNKEVQVGEGTYGAENVANYSIDQGITIDSITLIGDKKTVVLKTSDLTSGNDYTITINNVQDVSFTPNQIADNTTTIVSYKVKFRYLKFTMTKKGSLNPKVEEMRYIEKGTEYGTGKAYWGEGVSNPEEAFDANGGTVVSMGTNDVVGLDMGIGFEIAPDSIKIQLDKSNGRNIEGFRVEGSNDYTNWTLLFEADTFLVQGATHYIAFDLSALDPDSILTGAKSVQVIDFPAIGDQDINNSPINLNATASSGLPVTYYVLSGPGSVSSDQLTLTDTGEVWIRATQDGDDNYYSAYPVEQTFMVYGNITNQKEFIDTHKMSVYPVPADKYINVSGVPEGMTVRLYNINGVLLKSEMSDGIIRMDISDLNKGLYLLKANGKVCKIIKK